MKNHPRKAENHHLGFPAPLRIMSVHVSVGKPWQEFWHTHKHKHTFYMPHRWNKVWSINTRLPQWLPLVQSIIWGFEVSKITKWWDLRSFNQQLHFAAHCCPPPGPQTWDSLHGSAPPVKIEHKQKQENYSMSPHWVHPFSEVLNTALNKFLIKLVLIKPHGLHLPQLTATHHSCCTGLVSLVIHPRNYVGGEGSPHNQFDLGTRQAVPLSYSLWSRIFNVGTLLISETWRNTWIFTSVTIHLTFPGGTFLFHFLAVSYSIWDLNFLTRDQTCISCSGR